MTKAKRCVSKRKREKKNGTDQSKESEGETKFVKV